MNLRMDKKVRRWTGAFIIGLAWALAAPALLAQQEDSSQAFPYYPQGKPLEGLVITIDAGHGGQAHQPGYTGSARGVNSRVVEGDLNMLVTAQLRHHLVDAGAKVYMTRSDDRKVTPGASERAEELGARVRLADVSKSHLFISLHHNAVGRSTANGVVILIWPTDSKGAEQPLERALADILREEVEKVVPHTSAFPHYVHNHPLSAGSDVPSAVIEFGFLTNPEFDAWVSEPGRHREEAVGAFNGIVRMWRDHGAQLEALRRERFPELASADSSASATPSGESKRRAVAAEVPKAFLSLADSLWPFDDPPNSASQLEWVFGSYRKRVLSDHTTFYLKTDVQKTESGWKVRGATNQPILKTVAETLPLALGCAPLEADIELLPSARLGEQRFGVCRIPMALTWGSPREGDNVQTQLLLGEPLFLLDESPDQLFLLVQGMEGYIGWVRNEAVLRMTESDFAEWEKTGRRALVQRDFMADDFRIPAGAILPVIRGGDFDTTVVLRLPAGVRGTNDQPRATMPRYLVRFSSGREKAGAAVAAALQFRTVPYVFGGRSRLGLDCSGLTSVAWAAAGVALPRDAFQQALMGKLTATPWYWRELQPGDLLFFIDQTGRVIHTGVSLGGARFVHASPPEVHVTSLDPSDPLYSPTWAKAFSHARRPLP